jgi:hypothetical protein
MTGSPGLTSCSCCRVAVGLKAPRLTLLQGLGHGRFALLSAGLGDGRLRLRVGLRPELLELHLTITLGSVTYNIMRKPHQLARIVAVIFNYQLSSNSSS